MTARYLMIGLPNDGTWSCQVCGAVVVNRQLHDTYAHLDWSDASPEKIAPKQYDEQPPRPGVYQPPPPQRQEPA